jgi:CelD/BcsL family acetyltransferase involved in cellulose biosynthesis
MCDGQLIDSFAGAEALAGEWDALAVAASQPVVAPAWILAWLRRVHRQREPVRIVAVRDRGELIGLLPLYVAFRGGLVEYRMMSSDYGVCVEPLSLPGREWDVAAAAAEVLAACRPRPAALALGPVSVASHWPTALSASWPGPMPALARRYAVEPAPVVVLGGRSFEDWFGALTPKMRSNVRRTIRRFEQAGGRCRLSTDATLRRDAEAFANLHLARWRGRGRSRLAALGDGLADWIEELGRELLAQRRFQMRVLELDSSPICVDFSLIAGDELAAINVGWDERYAKLAPPRIAAVRLVEDACVSGYRRLHLGRGSMQNKLWLANGSDPVACSVLLVPSPRLPGTYLQFLPGLMADHARDVAKRALPPPWLEAIREARDRVIPVLRRPVPQAQPSDLPLEGAVTRRLVGTPAGARQVRAPRPAHQAARRSARDGVAV